MNERQQLEQAIAALEEQRALLGESVVEAAIGPMREKLAALMNQEQPEQQRKQATLLFMDIAGHTQLIRDLDPEENMDIIDQALVRLAQPVKAYGGHVARYQGDGFKAVFGLPTAREDDPERAVRAGLAIQATAQEIASQLEMERGIPGFRVRVGIDTGLVVSGGMTEGEDTVKGIPVNLAARLESSAQPGSLYISHNTYRHIRGVFDVLALNPIQIKGFPHPVQVYQVLRAKPRAFRMATRGVEGIETRMVGRQAEFQQLQDIFDVALRESETQVVTILGEPGIGKSRLLYEFEQWVELLPEPIRIYRGRAMPGSSSTPFGLLRSMFAFRFNILENDPLETVRQKLENGLSESLETDPVLKSHFIGALLGYDFRDSPYLAGLIGEPKQLKAQAMYYLGQFLTAQTSQNMVLVLFEDIHWSDHVSLDVVLQLARDHPGQRLMVVCLTRPVLFESRPHWGQGENSNTLLELKPLPQRACRLLVSEILQKVNNLTDELQEQIIANAEGNPYFVEELVKILIDNGVIIKNVVNDVWRVDSQRLPDLRIPPTLTAVLQARLDALPEVEKTTLQQAAVVGRIFWDAAVQILQEADQPPHLALLELTRRELIYPREASVFAGTDEYIIRHALLRDVVYESVLKRARRIYHHKTADWLVSATESSGRADEYAAIIGGHYEQASKMVAAAEWYNRAGERARSQSALREALVFFERVLILLPLEDREPRWHAMQRRCSLLADLAQVEGRQEALEALLELAKEIGDPYRLAESYSMVGYFLANRGEDRRALPVYDTALEAARQAGNRTLQARMMPLKIVSLSRLGEWQAAAALVDEALALTHQVTDANTLARAYTNIAIFFTESGDLARAIEMIQQAVDYNRRQADRVREAICLSNLGYNYVLLGLLDLSLPALRRSIELAETVGAKRIVGYARLNLGLAYFRHGDLHEARQTLEETLPVLKSIGDNFAQASTFSYLAFTLEATGDTLQACSYFSGVLDSMDAIDAQRYASDALAGLARCTLAEGKLDEARQHAAKLWASLQQQGSKGMEFPIWAYLTCVQVFEAAGDIQSSRMALHSGYLELMNRAEKISIPEWRSSYLANIPEHQKITAWWLRMENPD